MRKLMPIFLALLVTGLHAEESAAYPCWRGIDGSGAGQDSGRSLVDDFGQAKLVWSSQADHLWSGYAYLGGAGCAGPVLADGRLYVNFSIPSGDVLADEYFNRLWPMKNITSV